MKGEGAAELKVLKDYTLVGGEVCCRMPDGVLSRCVGQEEAQIKLKKYMTRLADPARRSAFTADFKERASIGQAWVKIQTESKPNVGPTSSR